jgi:hypothetical protein
MLFVCSNAVAFRFRKWPLHCRDHDDDDSPIVIKTDHYHFQNLTNGIRSPKTRSALVRHDIRVGLPFV